MKRYKKENNEKLEISQVFYTKRFVLTLDRSLCKGCVLCKLICPREAIEIKPAVVDPEGRVAAPVIDIDENKCDFHGICAVACPFSAIKISINGSDEIPAVSKDVFPVLTRDIEIDTTKCEPSCIKCEEACPLGAISINDAGACGGVSIDVKSELCAGCLICWEECPSDAVKVTKFIEGSIRVEQELCPDGCRKCLDVCPLNALYVGDNNKIDVKDINCIYCGACQNVCPVPEALSIVRTSIRHSPIESGAWNKGLEKITSTAGLNKELSANRTAKARDAVRGIIDQKSTDQEP